MLLFLLMSLVQAQYQGNRFAGRHLWYWVDNSGRRIDMNSEPLWRIGYANSGGYPRFRLGINVYFYDTISFDTSNPCDACNDFAYFRPLVCTDDLFDRLRLDVTNPEHFLRYFAERGGYGTPMPLYYQGFVLPDYCVGLEAYDVIVRFLDALVENPDVVITLRNDMHALLHGYPSTMVGRRLRFYKRSYSYSAYTTYGDYYGCGMPDYYGARVNFDVYFTAMEDGSDVDQRWNAIRVFFNELFFREIVIYRDLSGLFHRIPSVVEYNSELKASIGWKELTAVVLVPADIGDFLHLLDNCSLCDLVDGINSLVEAYNWGTDRNYWQDVFTTGRFTPRFDSWMLFMGNLLRAVRPVYQPCVDVGSSFVVPISEWDPFPWGSMVGDPESAGRVGSLAYDMVLAGGMRYIPVLYTRAGGFGDEFGVRSAVYLDTCSRGMVWLANSTRFATYVLFTIWFLIRLRKLFSYVVDGLPVGGDRDG